MLAVSGLGLLALAAGGAGLALQGSALRAPRRPLLALDDRSFAVLAAVADRFCPGAPGLPSAWQIEVPESIDLFLASAHPGVADELMQALAVLENGLPGLLLDGQPRPFTQRSAAQQDATLQRFATSRFELRRVIYKALLGLVTATYWGDARTFAWSGYRPPDFSEGAP